MWFFTYVGFLNRVRDTLTLFRPSGNYKLYFHTTLENGDIFYINFFCIEMHFLHFLHQNFARERRVKIDVKKVEPLKI